MEVSPRKRFEEIDIAKGIGILLVIIVHCFPDGSTPGGVSVKSFRILHDILYPLPMPLMFMLSGFLSQRMLRLSDISSRIEYIKDRFLRLIIPYFTIGLLYMPIKLILSRFANQPYDIQRFWQIIVGENPNGALWFLWVLFVTQALLGLFISKKSFKYLLPISAILSILIVILDLSFYRLDDAIYYTFFVLLGLTIGSRYEYYQKKINIVLAVISFVIFCVCVFLSLEKEMSVFNFICGITGSFIVLYLSRLLSQSRWAGGSAGRILSYFGKYSMDMYVLHGIVMVAIRIPLWSILKLNYYICTAAILVGGLLIPILISKYILRKSKLLQLLILGER